MQAVGTVPARSPFHRLAQGGAQFAGRCPAKVRKINFVMQPVPFESFLQGTGPAFRRYGRPWFLLQDGGGVPRSRLWQEPGQASGTRSLAPQTSCPGLSSQEYERQACACSSCAKGAQTYAAVLHAMPEPKLYRYYISLCRTWLHLRWVRSCRVAVCRAGGGIRPVAHGDE